MKCDAYDFRHMASRDPKWIFHIKTLIWIPFTPREKVMKSMDEPVPRLSCGLSSYGSFGIAFNAYV